MTLKQLHELIRDYRLSKGITQTHISEVTGISNKRISNIETGRAVMKADEYILICERGLGVSPSFFANQVLESKNAKASNE